MNADGRTIDPSAVSPRERYQLITSLVVPRPIGWISTYGEDGTPNLAPFSYFAALSSSPMLVGVSIGHRQGIPKDTLSNVRARGAFAVNVVCERLLEPMNASSADVPAGVDEFLLAGLESARCASVDAPHVVDCPAVLECVVEKEVPLAEAPNTLVIGRVMRVLLAAGVTSLAGSLEINPASLRPVGRLSGAQYGLLGEIRTIPRPG